MFSRWTKNVCIPCVPHKINCKHICSHDMKQTYSSIIIVRNVCVLTSVSTTMARLINMHTDLQISSCWEHISTWNMHEYLSKCTAVFQIEFSGKNVLHQNWCNITLRLSMAMLLTPSLNLLALLLSSFYNGNTCLWMFVLLKGILSTKIVIFHTQNYCRFPYWPS
jgi:hypothetical protein